MFNHEKPTAGNTEEQPVQMIRIMDILEDVKKRIPVTGGKTAKHYQEQLFGPEPQILEQVLLQTSPDDEPEVAFYLGTELGSNWDHEADRKLRFAGPDGVLIDIYITHVEEHRVPTLEVYVSGRNDADMATIRTVLIKALTAEVLTQLYDYSVGDDEAEQANRACLSRFAHAIGVLGVPRRNLLADLARGGIPQELVDTVKFDRGPIHSSKHPDRAGREEDKTQRR